jgi:hypothetical protein
MISSTLFLPLFLLSSLFLLIISLFPVNRFPQIHGDSVIVACLLTVLTFLFLAYSLLNVHYILSILLMLATLLIPLVLLFRKKFHSYYWELLIFLVVVFWDISLALYL